MFPGCGSAWKKPCTRICSQKMSIRRRATSAGSTPRRRRPSTSVTRTPGAYSITSTRRELRSCTMAGTRTSVRPASCARIRSAFSASCTKSSSSGTYFRTSSMRTRKSKPGSSRARMPMSTAKFPRSAATTRSMSGYWILTATSRPSCRRPRCTWASDAEAIGSGSRDGEELLDRGAELAAEDRRELGERPRRHLVLEARQHLDVLRRQHVGARAEELADLDGQALEARRETIGAFGAPPVMPGVAGLRRRRRPSTGSACSRRRRARRASRAP